MLLSNCTVCSMKKSTFIKNKEIRNFNNISNEQFKINKTINKFLLNGDKVIPELNLKQPLIVLVDHLLNILKDRERIQKFRETGNLKHIYIYRIILDKACFAHYAAYSDSKAKRTKRTISEKILKDRAY